MRNLAPLVQLLEETCISVDWNSGAVSGASSRERVGLALIRLAAMATQSPERPGFSKLVAALTRVFPSEKLVRVRLSDDTVFQFPYGDGYWSVLCVAGFCYEPEIDAFVRRCAGAGISYVFLDCGANFGYWSCRISGQAAGAQKVIAVEASEESFKFASRNRELNGNRFELHHRAVSRDHGLMLDLFGDRKHEQRSLIAGSRHDAATETVRSVTLDRLKGVDFNSEKLVLKLDLEGMEIAALEGGGRWLAGEALVIFEDHGSDRQHRTARAMRDQFGLRLFAGNRQGEFVEIHDLSQMDGIKKRRRKGYDFFASSSPFWIEFLVGSEAG